MNIVATLLLLKAGFILLLAREQDDFTEPSLAAELEPTTEWPWVGSWFDTMHFKLGTPTSDNAFPVLVVHPEDGAVHAVCDDLWTDKSALALCKMEGYEYGRRASVTTDLDYLYTGVQCFEEYELLDLSSYGKPLFVIANAVCSSSPVSKKASLPCSKRQAAAVHCYNDPWFNIFHGVELSATEQEFSIKFRINFVKLGKFYDALAENPLDSYPEPSLYSAKGCENDVEVSLEALLGDKVFYLKGNFPADCGECVNIMLDGKPLFNKICKTLENEATT